MNYVEFVAGNQEYKLRLTTKGIVALEKQLGCNPLSIFGEGDTIPTITTMIAILHNSLQSLNHGINYDKTFEIWDAWIADGHSMTDFLPVIIDIYKHSGLIRVEENAEEEVKN